MIQKKRSFMATVKAYMRMTIPITVVMLMVVPCLILFQAGEIYYMTAIMVCYGVQMWALSDL